MDWNEIKVLGDHSDVIRLLLRGIKNSLLVQ
jgi:hypothetical protein